MKNGLFLDTSDLIDDLSYGEVRNDGTHEVAPDLSYMRLAMVNFAFYGEPGAAGQGWVLVDTGIAMTARYLIRAAEQRFGQGARPHAIILTHAHFDHIGNVRELAERWQVPVYAHESELPYLDGRTSYPPPDPLVGGGAMSLLSPLYPREPVDVRPWLQPLPTDGSVPGMPEWRWIATHGHTPGHISLWRAADHMLIAGDAFITTEQESAYSVLSQEGEINGPPMYYTQDWQQARATVEQLAALEPELVITGHGPAMRGSGMRAALHRLARNFERIAIPDAG